MYGDALRVHAAHDVADGAVLAGGVQRLEHDDDAVRVLSGQPLLILAQQLDAVRQKFGALFLVQEPGLVAGVEMLLERHLSSRRDAQWFDEFGDALWPSDRPCRDPFLLEDPGVLHCVCPSVYFGPQPRWG